MDYQPTQKQEKTLSVRATPPKLLNVQEAAAYLAISEKKLRRLISDRQVPVVRIGRRIVLRTVDLDRFVESLIRQPARIRK